MKTKMTKEQKSMIKAGIAIIIMFLLSLYAIVDIVRSIIYIMTV